mgnify:CR=1 FL=1
MEAKEVYETEYRHEKKDYDDMFDKIKRKEDELDRHLASELKTIKEEHHLLDNHKTELMLN